MPERQRRAPGYAAKSATCVQHADQAEGFQYLLVVSDLQCHAFANDRYAEGGHAAVAPGAAPYGRMLSGIRGVRLAVLRVDAKFKYDDANPVEHRQRVIGRLEQRGHGLDTGAAAQQRRRLAVIGDWKTRRQRP